MRLHTLAIVAAAAALTPTMASAAVITYAFTGDTPAATGTTGGDASSVGGGSFSTGNNLGTIADPVNNSSASSGYSGASGGENIGVAARTGALSTTASTGSAYFEVTLTPSSGYKLQVTDFDFGVRSTSTGAQAYTLLSSTSSYSTASSLTTGTIANDGGWASKDNTVNSVTGADNAAITLRLYVHGGTGSPGSGTINTRLDDIRIGVTAIAIPEPAAAAMIAAVGALGLRRCRA